MGNPSVLKAAFGSRAHLVPPSLAKKSTFGLVWLPYCGLISIVRRVGRR
jgi:hypothetical protein